MCALFLQWSKTIIHPHSSKFGVRMHNTLQNGFKICRRAVTSGIGVLMYVLVSGVSLGACVCALTCIRMWTDPAKKCAIQADRLKYSEIRKFT